jgi:hypothetical protein
MAAGRIVEAGPPEELARAEGGVFAGLLARANAVHDQIEEGEEEEEEE